jgi:hypothetical protein
MSGWHPNTLLSAVQARLNADTGTGGLLNASTPLATAVWTRRFPMPDRTATEFPYVICYFSAIEPIDAFQNEGSRIGIMVEWFVDETASGIDGMERAGKILERVVGDWTDTGGPSYGLSRWQPTLQTGWTASPIIFESASDESFNDGLGVIRWNAMFSVEVSKPKTA